MQNDVLRPGMHAAIHGLNGRVDLNGHEIEVLKLVEGKGRWVCRVIDVVAESVLVRPQNLVRCPPRLTEIPDEVLVLLLERIPISSLSLTVSVTSWCLRNAVQKTWRGPEWRRLRRFFSRLTARAEKQGLVRDAIDANDLRTLRTIFREEPAWLTESLVDSAGSTAATIATAQPDALRMLLDEFACDVNTRRADGSTLLIDACMKTTDTSEECARILCERGADLYAVDDDGDGALYYAHDNGNEGCVQVLRAFGVRGRPHSPVHTSSAGFMGFQDLLPRHFRMQLNAGDYTHWNPDWD